MNPSSYQVRRATVEDLPVLRLLWQEAQLPLLQPEKRLTEFQVVLNEKNQVLGAIGLQIKGHEGLMHSEVFLEPTCTDDYRDELWRRLKVVATNHSLVRLWTREDAPYWHHIGFKPCDKGLLQTLTEVFGEQEGHWSCHKLRDELALPKSLDQELAIFAEAQRQETAAVLRKAKIWKYIAAGIALVFLGMVVVVGFLVLRPTLPGLHR
jgi:N-acetylglutamate synthase-like GNAT family acetyltransferase